MYKRIMVPMDGSKLAERILPHVKTIAKATGARVTLLRVVSPHAEFALEAPREAKQRLEIEQTRAAKYLGGVAKDLAKVGVKATPRVALGEAAVQILNAAEREKADLIALMSHGETGLSAFDRGSVAEKVLKTAPRPVLLVRAFRTKIRILDASELWSIKG